MSTYLIGDVHGCYHELNLLLSQAKFKPHKDQIWLTGDLIARGPSSLDVLRFLCNLDNCVKVVLGNHDLHLLAVYEGLRKTRTTDHLHDLLEAHDINEIINWLRHQPLLQIDEERKIMMSHAGIAPQWDVKTVKLCAEETRKALQGDDYLPLLGLLNNNLSNYWSPALTGMQKLCFNINVFTRMRYCHPTGQLDLITKKIQDHSSSILIPWFNMPLPVAPDYTIVFGHWSTLNGLGTPDGIICLDTGCCWGGCLSMLRWEDKKIFKQKSLSYKNYRL
ncbi:bis(5'-nucleosyl)-tetraphosphatase (symmetrical) ApaH [Candidatus Erwinia haradaeae]|uniref:Bis(5'-nucleosyl)-tetraphosphatase, symmetrical n=1 Tax=Candidatus Erwinia haradaeae TaxID=1922217 RepID=A0A451D748_9GAMM|nr:bis(5'-nucleosyl)-tetraphosphatase (symmetrical) ApaH [Candidatus Erwinia haradaeae]VFP81681.1 Bis(5'-nucleosyl)-tetraphosphatase [symmetrical] [Candidatus Erwinia haradaeae]